MPPYPGDVAGEGNGDAAHGHPSCNTRVRVGAIVWGNGCPSWAQRTRERTNTNQRQVVICCAGANRGRFELKRGKQANDSSSVSMPEFHADGKSATVVAERRHVWRIAPVLVVAEVQVGGGAVHVCCTGDLNFFEQTAGS